MALNKKFLALALVVVACAGALGIYMQGTPVQLASFGSKAGEATQAPETASFAKPAKIVGWSNGFPSGEHYNLNIHGKKPGFNCDSTPGGGSVFVPEYGDSVIQYIQNKKARLTGMNVIDPCGFGNPAKVQLPSGEYQVYARILAKPRKEGEERKVILYPRLIDACDDTGEVDFGTFTECSDSELVGIGKVTKDGAFDKTSEELERIAPVKGRNKAKNMTELFQWTGYVCDPIYDIDGDGEITLADITVDYDEDGYIDADDLEIYLELYCAHFENEWIFNIADLVVYGWDYHNMGSKLLQVRFYPEKTTTFE